MGWDDTKNISKGVKPLLCFGMLFLPFLFGQLTGIIQRCDIVTCVNLQLLP